MGNCCLYCSEKHKILGNVFAEGSCKNEYKRNEEDFARYLEKRYGDKVRIFEIHEYQIKFQ